MTTLLTSILVITCQFNISLATVRLVTLDPGHFHAALVQKSMVEGVDPVVHVYAPPGPDVQLHLDRINTFNTRADNPTHWQEEVYTGDDYLERMLADKKGNVVVISGNNQKKTEYIVKALQAGFHVLADKPMVINADKFELLKSAFVTAQENNLLLYDIMTERFEITSILQKELSHMPEIFGTLEKGTPDHPAVTKESVHHFYKFVTGKALTRPGWFFDVTQEGEGIVDVTTHLVDLIQWACFPDQVLDYTKDVQVDSTRHWSTDLTLDQFKAVTGMEAFPGYLTDSVHDDIINIVCNGEINYRLRGVHAKVSVTWAYRAPEGAGDTHYSIMRGTRANLVIRQGREQQFKPTLYIEPVNVGSDYASVLQEQSMTVQAKYPGVKVERIGGNWKVNIPDQYHIGHEAHFSQVTENYLRYLEHQEMPIWEVPNMITKYYITTKAFQLANEQ